MIKHVPSYPFRPTQDELHTLDQEVDAVREIQENLKSRHPKLHTCDRVAHQYQIAGSGVRLDIQSDLPASIQDIGLFIPQASYRGLGRISTGLGTPHRETNPDFLGLMLAFATEDRQRVDFLAINHPASPTDNHREFIDVLYATAAAAGEEMPHIGDWGDYDLGNLLAEQTAFAGGLKQRMGWMKAGKTLAHIIKQTWRTFKSSTAYQAYWTGLLELGDTVGKFTLVPVVDDNHRPGFRPGHAYLSQEWRERQARGDIVFQLYWIPFLDEVATPLENLTENWIENHRQLIGTATFPTTGDNSEEESLYAILAMEMGANPGNWVHNRDNAIHAPATRFAAARQLAYQKSQDGRNALDPRSYESIFHSGQFSPDLREELFRRRAEKAAAGHINQNYPETQG